MSGVAVEIIDRGLDEAMASIQRLTSPELRYELMDIVGREAQGQTRHRIMSEKTAPDGTEWPKTWRGTARTVPATAEIWTRPPGETGTIFNQENIMHVKIHTAAVPDSETAINSSAAELVRMGFNPSKIEAVDRIKALAAALISECITIRDAKGKGAREAAIAITEIQGGSMFAVAAATADL